MIFTETPVTYLEGLVRYGCRFYVKRDDLLPFSFGGNKVRIADEFIKDMRARGKNALIYYGDRRSNLCRVLANRCAIESIPSVMIATEENASSGPEPFNSRLIRNFGARILPCQKNGIASAVDEAFRILEDEGRSPYYIYGDRYGKGNEGTAARAYAGAWHEITDYEKRSGVSFDLIVTPCGTGATLTGLICGAALDKADREIIGISISSRTFERGDGIIRDGIRSYFRERGISLPDELPFPVHFETAYNKGGYGLYDEEVRETIRFMMERFGIPLDPTYTGKAFCGMLSYLRDRGISGKNVLFLHTGGLPLYFDYILEEG